MKTIYRISFALALVLCMAFSANAQSGYTTGIARGAHDRIDERRR